MGCLQSKIDSLGVRPSKVTRNNFFFSHILGEGGFGKVTAAQIVVFDNAGMSSQWFAVKEVRKDEIFKHKTGVDMLHSELKAMSRVTHPYIVRLCFAFADEMSCFFVMDMKVGGDLREYLKAGIYFEERDICIIVACMSSALDYMHANFILHRDVKPENIIFDDRGRPYLTDFGVSYVHDNKKAEFLCHSSSGTKQYL